MQNFTIPEAFLSKLYELSGSAGENKGFFLFVVDSSGEPVTLTSPMKSVTRKALRKHAETWLSNLNDMESIGGDMFEDEDE